MAKPDWAKMADETVDISDVWQEKTDPEGELGQECMVYYSVRDYEIETYDPSASAHWVKVHVLEGISVSDWRNTTYHGRADAIQMLGYDAVKRIEDAANA